MPSSRYFAGCPPFPNDVPIADIPTISLKRLHDGREKESVKLFDACRDYGFFLLDLNDSEQGRVLLKHAETMFDLTHDTLNLDKAVLDQYAYNPPKDLLGYKEAGRAKTDDGKVDSTEMYTIGQDDMVGTVPLRKNPEPVERHRNECRDFFTHAHAVVAIVLGALDDQFGLPKGCLANLSSLHKPSATSLRLLLTRPQQATAKKITLGAHTDIGLMTLLFHVAGGLQILPAASERLDENWRFIQPQQGCALINMGDTFVEWTGGLLTSGLHRVVTAPGEQKTTTRTSLAYLVRPARGESMRRLRGKSIPSSTEEDTRTVDEWAAERASQILQGNLKPRTTGGVSISTN